MFPISRIGLKLFLDCDLMMCLLYFGHCFLGLMVPPEDGNR
jgi:hypothetical protein